MFRAHVFSRAPRAADELPMVGKPVAILKAHSKHHCKLKRSSEPVVPSVSTTGATPSPQSPTIMDGPSFWTQLPPTQWHVRRYFCFQRLPGSSLRYPTIVTPLAKSSF